MWAVAAPKHRESSVANRMCQAQISIVLSTCRTESQNLLQALGQSRKGRIVGKELSRETAWTTYMACWLTFVQDGHEVRGSGLSHDPGIAPRFI